MNKSFKVVFNKARGALMVVNEVTSSVQAKGTKTVIAAAVAAMVAGGAVAAEGDWVDVSEGVESVTDATWDTLKEENNFVHAPEGTTEVPGTFLSTSETKTFDKKLWVSGNTAAAQATGLAVSGAQGDLTNKGTIYVTSGKNGVSYQNKGIWAGDGATATNEGVIVAKNAYGMTVGSEENGAASKIVNKGTVSVVETGAGMELGGASGSEGVNAGLISVGAPTEEGDGGTLRFGHGVLINTAGNTFTNKGTIDVADVEMKEEGKLSAIEIKDKANNTTVHLEAGSAVNGEVHIASGITGTVLNANGFKGTVNLNNDSNDLTFNILDGAEVTLMEEGHGSTVSIANVENGRLNASIWGTDNKFGQVFVEKDGIFNITKLNSGGDSKDLENKPHNQLLIKGADYTLNGGKLFVAGSNYEGKLKLGTIDTKGTLTVNGGDYAFSSVIMGGAAGNALTINNGSVTVGEYNATWGTTAVNGGVLSIGTLKLENAPVGTLTVGDDATLEITDGIDFGDVQKGYVQVNGTLRADASIAVAKDEKGTWAFTATDDMVVFAPDSNHVGTLELTGLNSFTQEQYKKLAGELNSFDLILVDGQLSDADKLDLADLSSFEAINNAIAVESEQGEKTTASATLTAEVGVGALTVGEKTQEITISGANDETYALTVRGVNGKVVEGVDSVKTLTAKNLVLGAYETDKATVNADHLVVDSLDVVGDFTAQHVTVNIDGSTDNRFEVASLDGDGKFTVDTEGTLKVSHLAVKEFAMNQGSTLVLGDRLQVEQLETVRAPADDVQYHDQIDTTVQTAVDSIVTTNSNGRNLLKAVAGDKYGASTNSGLYVDDTVAVDREKGKLFIGNAVEDGKEFGDIGLGASSVTVIDVSAFADGQAIFVADKLHVNENSTILLKGADRVGSFTLVEGGEVNDISLVNDVLKAGDTNAWLGYTVAKGTEENAADTFLNVAFEKQNNVSAEVNAFAESVLTAGSESLGVVNAIGTTYRDETTGGLSNVGAEALDEYMALPAVAGTYNAAYDAAEQVWNTIGAHNIDRTVGKTNGVWADVFYSANEAGDMYGNGYGYEADVYGGVLGYDYTAACGGKIGAALTIGTSDVDAKGDFIGDYGNDADFWGLSIYASKDITEKMIVSADITYLSLDNDIKGSVAGASVAESIDSSVISVGLRADWKAYESNAFEIVPHAGIRYAQIDVDDYREMDGESLDVLEMPIGVAFNGKFEAAGMKFVPTLDFTVVPQIGDTEVHPLNGDTLDVLNNTYNTTLGISAEYGDFTFGVAAKYGFGTDDRSNAGVKVNATYAF